MNKVATIIIPIYLLIITGVIIYTGRKVKTFKDYALAGGGLPWYVISGTIVATFIGGGTMLGFVGSYYEYGLQWFWMCFGTSMSHLFMAYFLANRIRRFEQYTIADLFKIRYGEKTKFIAGIVNMVVGVAVGFAMLASFASMLNGYLGISMDLALILGVILFALTATMGGLVGVAYTDALQAVIIIIGAIVVTSSAFIKAGGASGISTLEFKYTSLATANIPWFAFIGTIIASVGVGLADQSTIFQRVNATKSPQDARKATIGFAWITFGAFILMGIMGLSARVILGSGVDENLVVGQLLNTLNPFIGALYASAVIAAVLTTANSMYLSASMTFSRDIMQTIKPELEDKTLLNIARVFVWVMATISFFVVKYQPNIMKYIMFGYKSISCMIIPLYGGLMSKKATPASGYWSLLLSIIAVLIWEITGLTNTIDSMYIALIVGSITFFIGTKSKNKSSLEQLEVVDTFKAKQN